jgi:hypothetical protein
MILNLMYNARKAGRRATVNLVSSVKTKVLVATLVTVLAGSAFGYWGVASYEQQERRDDILWLVQDASLRLRSALASAPPASNQPGTDVLRFYYDHAVAVDGHLQKLRAMDTSGAENLADAVEHYLITSREILLRRASRERHHGRFNGDLRRLREHMRADDRSGAWITAAVRAKERVEEDYRDFRIATTALIRLLDEFPATQARISPHVAAVHLLDDATLAQARERVGSASQATARELDRYANLNRYR